MPSSEIILFLFLVKLILSKLPETVLKLIHSVFIINKIILNFFKNRYLKQVKNNLIFMVLIMMQRFLLLHVWHKDTKKEESSTNYFSRYIFSGFSVQIKNKIVPIFAGSAEVSEDSGLSSSVFRQKLQDRFSFIQI